MQAGAQKKEEGREGGADRKQDPVADAETEELLILAEKHPTVLLVLLVRTRDSTFRQVNRSIKRTEEKN